MSGHAQHLRRTTRSVESSSPLRTGLRFVSPVSTSSHVPRRPTRRSTCRPAFRSASGCARHHRGSLTPAAGERPSVMRDEMSSAEWYRHTECNEEISERFEARLKRARRKAQYLRIQACSLARSEPRVALQLLDRYFELRAARERVRQQRRGEKAT